MYVPDKNFAKRAIKEAKVAENKSKKGYYLDSARYIRQAINDEGSIQNQNAYTSQAIAQMQNMENRYLNPTFQNDYLNLGSKQSTKLARNALKSLNYVQPQYNVIPPTVPPQIRRPMLFVPQILRPQPLSPPPQVSSLVRLSPPVRDPSPVGPPIQQNSPDILPVQGTPSSPRRRRSPPPSRRQTPNLLQFTPQDLPASLLRPAPLPPVQFRNNVPPTFAGSLLRLVFGGTPEENYAAQRESFRVLLNNIGNEKREIIQLMEIARDPMVRNRREDLEIFLQDSNVIYNEQFPEMLDASKNAYRLDLINNFKQILQHEQDLRRRITENVHMQDAATPVASPIISASPAVQASQLRQQEQDRRAEEQASQRAAEIERQRMEQKQQQLQAQQQLQQAQQLAAQAAQLVQPPPQPNLVNLRVLPLRQRGRLPAQIDLRLQLEALSNQQLEEIALGNGTSAINNIPVRYLGLTQRQLDRYKNRQGVLNTASLIQSIVTATRTASLILRGGEMLNIQDKKRWYFYINGVEGSRKALDLNHAATIVQQFRFQYPFTQVRLGSPGKFSVVFGEEVPMPKAFSYSSNNTRVNINGFY